MSTYDSAGSDVRREQISTEDGPGFRTTYNRSSGRPLSIVVVDAVEAALDRATELEPLYDIVDPDALDQLFQHKSDGTPRPGGELTFAYSGCEVTVRADGDVIVVPPAES